MSELTLVGTAPLTEAQKHQLEGCEQRIRNGQEAFFQTAAAYHEIYINELFKPDHDTFPDYCLAVWNIERNTANRYRQAGEVLLDIKDATHKPTNEGQTRELFRAPRKSRLEIWNRIVDASEKAGKPITAADITKVVNKEKAKADAKKGKGKDGDGDNKTQVSFARNLPVTATVVLTLADIEATVLKDSGFRLKDLGDGKHQMTKKDSRKTILRDLAKWNLLDKVQALSIEFK